MSGIHKTSMLLLALLILVPLQFGCALYQFGNEAVFPQNIRTVHVPVVRNDTFRHDLGVRLTEALVKEIERRTPFKVTGDPNADSTLRCHLVDATKTVVSESESDDPRALSASLVAKATWVNRTGQMLMNNRVSPSVDPAIAFGQDTRFVPEAGQSIDTANQRVIEDLAERIVSQMEIRW